MDLHAAHTQGILDMIEYPAELWDVPRVAAYHHEKMDGSGPFGIDGDKIPLTARVISVADVFDALATDRPYRAAMPLSEVFALLDRGAGRDWDVSVIAALRDALPDILTEVYARDPEEAVALQDDSDDSMEQAA